MGGTKKNRENDTRIANSFSVAEVDAVLLLHRTALRGGELAAQLTSPAVLSVVRKFQAMQLKQLGLVAHGKVVIPGSAQAAAVGRSS